MVLGVAADLQLLSTEGEHEVADIYTGCRMSLVPLRSGLSVTSRLTANTPKEIMNMTNESLLTALGVAGGHQVLLTVFCTGCRINSRRSAAVWGPEGHITDNT